MLNTFRNNKRGIFGVVIIGFCALLMVPFGIDMIRQGGAGGASIRINDTEVTANEYFQRLYRWQNMARQQFGQNYEQLKGMLNLEQRTIDEIINEALLNQFANDFDLGASKVQVQQEIKSHPFFAGGFNRTQFDAFLRAQGLTEAGLQVATEKQIVAKQLESILSDLTAPSEDELKAVYRDENRKASFRYISFTPTAFEAKVPTDDEEKLKAYYEDFSELYRKKKAVAYKYVAFGPGDFINKVELSEDDLLDAYNSSKQKFVEPKQVRLRQMLFRKSPSKKDSSGLEELIEGGSTDAGKDKAEAALKRLEEGEPFPDLAASLSEDKKTAKSGGDLGWARYSVLETPIRTAAAELEKGTFSEVLETKAGFQIVYIEDKKEKRQKTFEEVKSELEKTLRTSDAPVYASAAADEFYQEWEEKNAAGAISLEDFAKEKKLMIEGPKKPISKGEFSPGVSGDLTAKVVLLGQGDREVFAVNDTTYVIEVTEVVDSFIPEFEKVKDQVIADYKKKEAAVFAKRSAEEALAKLLASNDQKAFDALAKEYAQKVETTESATRTAAQGPIFMSPEAKRDAFTLSENNPNAKQVYSVGTSHYLIQLSTSSTPSEEDFSENIDQLKKAENTKVGTRLTAMLLKRLRQESDVWVDPGLLDSDKS